MKHKSKGMASVVILFAAAVLTVFSLGIIKIAGIGINVNTEKQLLDTCSIKSGQDLIKTNNIEEVCSGPYLQSCIDSLGDSTATLQCLDEGLECNDLNECKRKLLIKSTYIPNGEEVTKSSEVYVNEESHEVNIVDAAVILLLDFSGSMQGNRITQLKNSVRQFVNSRFNLSYSVILYNSNVIETSNIGKGLNHDQSVLSIINTRNPGGGTNFVAPLSEALNQINTSNHEVYYILLISDGSPNEGSNPSINFVENNIMSIEDNNCILSTTQDPCITIFTLGVDNADTNTLGSISGNTLSRNTLDYMYTVNANQTTSAFNAIIEEIMCRIGPVIANDSLYVFDDLSLLEENIDYVFDNQNKILKFYDEEPFNICTNMLNNNSNIVLRWGNPLLRPKD